MMDALLGAMWIGVLLTGLATAVIVRAVGVGSTYVRDMLHIGASVWILGWPYWDASYVPIAITACVALATAAAPRLARHIGFAKQVVRSVTNGEEHWTGLVHYTLAYAVLTAFALNGEPFPAAAALLALSLGDGIGGAVGRSFGRHRYQIAGAKPKSFEGSITVALAASAGIAIAALLFDRDVAFATVVLLGGIAALAEAIAPRSSDNLVVPFAVWTTATLLT